MDFAVGLKGESGVAIQLKYLKAVCTAEVRAAFCMVVLAILRRERGYPREKKMLHVLIEGIRMSIKRFADAWDLKHASLILSMVATGFAPTVLAEPMPLSAPINPDFVQHQMMLGTGSIQQAPAGRAKGYIPSPFDRSHMSGLTPVAATMSTVGVANVYPSSFDLRSSGKVTSVKQQGVCGSCWAFASEASTESNTLVGGGGIYNFSENHLNVRHGFDNLPCAGGNGDIRRLHDTVGWGVSCRVGLRE